MARHLFSAESTILMAFVAFACARPQQIPQVNTRAAAPKSSATVQPRTELRLPPKEEVRVDCKAESREVERLVHLGYLYRPALMLEHINSVCSENRHNHRELIVTLLSRLGNREGTERWIGVMAKEEGSSAAVSETASRARDSLAVTAPQAPASTTNQSESSKLLETSIDARLRGNWAVAHQVALEALRRYPANPDALLEAGVAASRLGVGNAVEANSLLDRALFALETKLGKPAKVDYETVTGTESELQWRADSNVVYLPHHGYDAIDARDGSVVRRLSGIAYAGESTCALSSSGDKFISSEAVFTADGHEVLRFPKQPGIYSNLIFAPDGRGVLHFRASATLFEIKLHDLTSAEASRAPSGELRRLSVRAIAAPNGTWFATKTDNNESAFVSAVDYPFGRVLSRFPGWRGTPVGNDKIAVYLPNLSGTYSASAETALRVYDVQSGKPLEKYTDLYCGTGGREPRLSASADGRFIVHAFPPGGPPKVIDRAKRRAIERGDCGEASGKFSGWNWQDSVISPNGRFLAETVLIDDTFNVVLRSTATGHVIWKTPRYGGGSAQPAVSPDGEQLAVADVNGITFYDLTGRPNHRRLLVRGVQSPVMWLDNESVFALLPGQAQARNAFDGRFLRSFSGCDVPTYLSGRVDTWLTERYVIATLNHRTCVWDRKSGGAVPPLERPPLAVSHSGRWVVSTKGPKTLDISEVGTDRLEQTLPGSTARSIVAFSSDDQLLVMKTSMLPCQVWDWRAGKLLAETSHEIGNPSKMVFTNEGAEVVALSEGRITVWDWKHNRIMTVFAPGEDAGAYATLVGRAGWMQVREEGQPGVSLGLVATDGKVLVRVIQLSPTSPGYAVTPDGDVEALSDNELEHPLCGIGVERFPWELCRGRFMTSGLLGNGVLVQRP